MFLAYQPMLSGISQGELDERVQEREVSRLWRFLAVMKLEACNALEMPSISTIQCCRIMWTKSQYLIFLRFCIEYEQAFVLDYFSSLSSNLCNDLSS